MTKSQLKSLSKDALLSEAKRLGLKAFSNLRKEELILKIAEALAKSDSAPDKLDQQAMDKKEAPKRESMLKKIIGAPGGDPGTSKKPTSYARKPASNIQRRKTTLRKVQKIVTDSREKRATKPAPAPMEPKAPPPVASPEEVLGAPTHTSHIVGHKFDIEPHQPPADTSRFDHLGELPDSYNTGTLFLVARDPHWLFAYWDYAWHQMAEFRDRADDHTVRLRIYRQDGEHSAIQQDLILHPDSKNWFIHVGQSRTHFRAELGYYSHGGFHVINRSTTVKTPADDLSSDTYARFATLPFHIKFHELVEYVRAHFRPGDELLDVLYRLQAKGFRLPFEYEGMDEFADDDMLLDLFGEDLLRRIQMGSFEISEWLRKRFREEALAGVTSWSSPSSSVGASWQKSYRNFWFNVNAEIILYGETDPRARVVVDGKEIKLRPDGSFRFHFALPDGQFRLPISAESPDRIETRAATIDFSRATGLQGEVGKAKAKEDLPDPVKV